MFFLLPGVSASKNWGPVQRVSSFAGPRAYLRSPLCLEHPHPQLDTLLLIGFALCRGLMGF